MGHGTPVTTGTSYPQKCKDYKYFWRKTAELNAGWKRRDQTLIERVIVNFYITRQRFSIPEFQNCFTTKTIVTTSRAYSSANLHQAFWRSRQNVRLIISAISFIFRLSHRSTKHQNEAIELTQLRLFFMRELQQISLQRQ